MRTYTIGKNDADQRLIRFLSRLMRTSPQSLIYKSLRKKRIKVNGKRITDPDFCLALGDQVELYISDELLPKEKTDYPWMEIVPSLRIIYEDENILVVDKPGGQKSQSTGGTDDLESQVRAYLYQKGAFSPSEGSGFLPGLCHRIDRNTEGLVLAAKNAAALRYFTGAIRDRKIKKFYLCETEGRPTPKEGTIEGYIKKDEKDRKVLFYREPQSGALPSSTRYRVLGEGKRKDTSLVEVELLTGRTHQIRAAFSAMGHPLVGDVKYGAKKDGGRKYQHLVAYKLVFDIEKEEDEWSYLNGMEIVRPDISI